MTSARLSALSPTLPFLAIAALACSSPTPAPSDDGGAAAPSGDTGAPAPGGTAPQADGTDGSGGTDGTDGSGGTDTAGDTGGTRTDGVIDDIQTDGNAVTAPLPTFTQQTLLTTPGAAWLNAEDLDGDGYPELLLTSLTLGLGWQTWTSDGFYPPLAAGAAHVVSRAGGPAAGSVGTWTATEYFGDGDTVWFPNESTVVDVDNDGVDDWVIAAGFLTAPYGQVVWYKGEATAGGLRFDTTLRTLPTPAYGAIAPWYHEMVPVDIDGDGDMDLVTTNHDGTPFEEGTSRVELWTNDGVTGEARFTVSVLATGVGGALFDTADLDGDGDLDIVLPQYFEDTPLVWLEQTGANGSAWETHVINTTTGRGFAAKVTDLDGDGGLDVVYTNHNHQLASDPTEQTMGLYWFRVPPADEIRSLDTWDAYATVIYEGFQVSEEDPETSGAPGVFGVHDVDGDGDKDIAVSGDGDEGLYLFVQNDGNAFERITLASGLQQAGGHVLFDIDLDGDQDLVWAVFGAWGIDDILTNWNPPSAVYAFVQD